MLGYSYMRFPNILHLLVIIAIFAASYSGADEISPQDKFREAAKAFSLKNFNLAVSYLKNLAENKPSNALYWFNLGAAYFSLEKYAESTDAFQRVVNLQSPLSRAARLYLAKAQMSLGKYTEAYLLLSKLSKERDLAVNLKSQVEGQLKITRAEIFKQAENLYEHQKYEEAKSHILLLRDDKMDADIDFFLGLIALKLNDKSTANQFFESSQNKNQDAEITHFSSLLSEHISKLSSHFYGRASVSGGFDSNIYQYPISSTNVGSGLLTADFDLRFPLLAKEDYMITLNFYPQWVESLGHSDNRYVSAAASIPVGIRLSHNLSLEMAPSLKYQNLGSQSLTLSPGIYGAINFLFGNATLKLSANYDQNIAESSAYSYLQGYSFLSFATLTSLVSSITLEARAGWHVESNQDYQSGPANYPLAFVAPLASFRAFIPLGERMRFSPSVSSEWRQYFTMARPENIQRSDVYVDLGGRLSYFNNMKHEIFLSFEQILNSTNLGTASSLDRNFNESRIVVGSALEFQ